MARGTIARVSPGRPHRTAPELRCRAIYGIPACSAGRKRNARQRIRRRSRRCPTTGDHLRRRVPPPAWIISRGTAARNSPRGGAFPTTSTATAGQANIQIEYRGTAQVCKPPGADARRNHTPAGTR